MKKQYNILYIPSGRFLLFSTANMWLLDRHISMLIKTGRYLEAELEIVEMPD